MGEVPEIKWRVGASVCAWGCGLFLRHGDTAVASTCATEKDYSAFGIGRVAAGEWAQETISNWILSYDIEKLLVVIGLPKASSLKYRENSGWVAMRNIGILEYALFGIQIECNIWIGFMPIHAAQKIYLGQNPTTKKTVLKSKAKDLLEEWMVKSMLANAEALSICLPSISPVSGRNVALMPRYSRSFLNTEV